MALKNDKEIPLQKSPSPTVYRPKAGRGSLSGYYGNSRAFIYGLKELRVLARGWSGAQCMAAPEKLRPSSLSLIKHGMAEMGQVTFATVTSVRADRIQINLNQDPERFGESDKLRRWAAINSRWKQAGEITSAGFVLGDSTSLISGRHPGVERQNPEAQRG
ncbi:unnamed protein product [Arctogadus glacialis]